MTLTLFSQEQTIQIQRLLELSPCEILKTGRLYCVLENAEKTDKMLGLAGTGNSVVAQVQCLLEKVAELEAELTEIDLVIKSGVKEVEIDNNITISTDQQVASSGRDLIDRQIEDAKRKIRRAIGYSNQSRINFVWNDGRAW